MFWRRKKRIYNQITIQRTVAEIIDARYARTVGAHSSVPLRS